MRPENSRSSEGGKCFECRQSQIQCDKLAVLPKCPVVTQCCARTSFSRGTDVKRVTVQSNTVNVQQAHRHCHSEQSEESPIVLCARALLKSRKYSAPLYTGRRDLMGCALYGKSSLRVARKYLSTYCQALRQSRSLADTAAFKRQISGFTTGLAAASSRILRAVTTFPAFQ